MPPPPSTPLRALPSTLASRAAPSVPPASQAYEPLVKNVLRHRLLSRIFLSSAVFVWGLVVVASTVRQGGASKLGVAGVLLNPILPRTLALTACIWAFGVVPIIACRKAYLTATPTPASSPSKVFHTSLSKQSTLRSLVVYVASASLLTIVHVVTASIFETKAGNDPRLSLFVKSRKHPFYLNGRLLYLLFSQICLAVLCAMRSVILDRNAVKWTGAIAASKRGEIPSFMLARVVTVAVSALLVTVLGTAAHIVLFGAARSMFLPIAFKLPFISRLLRPFLAHFLRGSWSVTLLAKSSGLMFRAFWLGVMTVATWDFAESLFDAYVAEPIAVAQTTADPALTIVSGTSSTDPYFQHFAYAELDEFANDDSEAGVARRTAFFTDQKYNPSMWSALVRQALLMLGKDYQYLLRRGAPPADAPAPAAAPTKVDVPPQFPKTPLVHQPVLKPAQFSPFRSAIETFASDGPITAALSSTAEASVSQIPELFRSVMPSQSAAVAEKAEAAVETVKKAEHEIEQLASLPGQWKSRVCEEIARRAPPPVSRAAARLQQWWRAERVYRIVEANLPNRKMDGLAIDALCALICASLEEDRYGVVQRDVPRILEALLSFLTAIEEYRAELIASHPQPSPEELAQMSSQEAAAKEAQAFELSRAGDVLSEVEDPLKDGIVKIVRTFGDKLSAFKFPPRTARKLQGFVDYN